MTNKMKHYEKTYRNQYKPVYDISLILIENKWHTTIFNSHNFTGRTKKFTSFVHADTHYFRLKNLLLTNNYKYINNFIAGKITRIHLSKKDKHNDK